MSLYNSNLRHITGALHISKPLTNSNLYVAAKVK